ncbi:CALCIUM-ACTIVATED CHLORIDE CHANNEL REGULATOR [Ceraceosorus bombacis]|uniref:CALCIUM-ACTIVATED CHLORIDE CHANNEL REGULATOR n=1 Tax=Ceraceosorus bombacis TaxID=401625 RepID=A0A0P1BSC8_9BASI|nr:CALCIUM-ACTIVATED CHLORIDE CHANNEL REGULATOR [Ceraceosorus bombacis]
MSASARKRTEAWRVSTSEAGLFDLPDPQVGPSASSELDKTSTSPVSPPRPRLDTLQSEASRSRAGTDFAAANRSPSRTLQELLPSPTPRRPRRAHSKSAPLLGSPVDEKALRKAGPSQITFSTEQPSRSPKVPEVVPPRCTPLDGLSRAGGRYAIFHRTKAPSIQSDSGNSGNSGTSKLNFLRRFSRVPRAALQSSSQEALDTSDTSTRAIIGPASGTGAEHAPDSGSTSARETTSRTAITTAAPLPSESPVPESIRALTQGLWKKSSFDSLLSSFSQSYSDQRTHSSDDQDHQRTLRKSSSKHTHTPTLPTVAGSPPDEGPPKLPAQAVQEIQRQIKKQKAASEQAVDQALADPDTANGVKPGSAVTETERTSPNQEPSADRVPPKAHISEQSPVAPTILHSSVTDGQPEPQPRASSLQRKANAPNATMQDPGSSLPAFGTSKWKLPFGKKSHSNQGNGDPASHSQSMKTQVSSESLPHRGKSGWRNTAGLLPKEDWDMDGRQKAAQQIAAQQRAAHESDAGALVPPSASNGHHSNRSQDLSNRAPSDGHEPSDYARSFSADSQRGKDKPEGYAGDSNADVMARFEAGGLIQRSGKSKLERMTGTPGSEVLQRLEHANMIMSPSLSGDRKLNGPISSASPAHSSPSTRAEALRGASSRESRLAYSPSSSGHAELAAAEEASCPVCLELLSFRLAGEKAHVVPTCGHALHHACFSAVYGAPEAVLASQGSQRSEGSGRPSANGPPGMCGVCRRPIVLNEDGISGRRSNKLTGMMGGDKSISSSVQRSISTESDSMQSHNGRDDPIEAQNVKRSKSRDAISEFTSMTSPSIGASADHRGTVFPLIKVRPEYTTVYRKDPTGQNGKQNIVCVLSIEIPNRRPAPTLEEEENEHRALLSVRSGASGSDRSIQPTESHSYRDDPVEPPSVASTSDAGTAFSPRAESFRDTSQNLGDTNSSTNKETHGASSPSTDDEGFSFGATPAADSGETVNPFKPVTDDLRQRIADWKGHSIERFGPLALFDFLGVRQDDVVRDFFVYLFKEALLCVAEERKKEKGLSRFIKDQPDRGAANDPLRSPLSPASSSNKTPLKLKGRIWIRHIRRVQDTSSEGDLSLSVKLDDDSLNHFVLCFKDRGTLESWRQKLVALVNEHRPPEYPRTPTEPKQAGASPAVGTPSTARRGTTSTVDAKVGGDIASPNFAGAGRQTGGVARRGSSDSVHHVMSRSVHAPMVAMHTQWSASGGLDPSLPPPDLLPHTPLDLIIMVSVPSVPQQTTSSTTSSSAQLKLRLIRSTLDFVAANMGPRDRLALVAYSVGAEGGVRRTSLLSPAKDQSKAVLEQFIESIGQPWAGEGEDPFRDNAELLGGSADRTDTITAVNVGLDIVLARTSKNPLTGMLLISDAADAPRRGQMDLVMARAEAGNVPVHSFGFGKSHDPSSLWLISNHTKGSYTFVREWYQLRECIAGCVGSLMSVASTDVRLHISVPSDNHFRVRKVAGPQGAIVSATGKDVDLELGELRFGDCKEIMVELELDFNGLVPFITEHGPDGRRNLRRIAGSAYEQGSATDDFMHRLGLENLNLASADGQIEGIGAHDNLIEEVAVFSVDAAFRDPAMGTSTSRLPDPCVLTLEVDANSQDPMSKQGISSGSGAALADPIVTRRRIEILVSDMITRSLLVVSRRNHAQALQILSETRRIVDTVLQATPVPSAKTPTMRGARSGSNVEASSTATATRSGGLKRQRDAFYRRTADSLLAILEDLDMLIDGLEQSKSSFDRDGRNMGAQQAMVLRDQRAWTSRTDTEWLRFRSSADNGPAFASRAAVYATLYGSKQ